MKIEIETSELEGILRGEYKALHDFIRINDRARSLYDEAYENGQRDKEEEIYKYLLKNDWEIDCPHGLPIWSCRECLK